jgi:hypothetical protein
LTTAAKFARDAALLQRRRDLRAATVHDHGADASVPQVDHVLGERALEVVIHHRVAAELDDDDLAGEALEPWQGFDENRGLRRRIRLADCVARDLGVHELYALFSWT